jgi:hypothetical protein
MIILEPIGGLCNRLRAIDSAIALSKEISKPLHVVWACNSDINCKFSRLFEIPEEIQKLTELKIRSRIIYFSINQLAGLYFSRSGNYYLKDITCLPEPDVFIDRLRRAGKIYIRAYSPFYPPAKLFRHFVPKAFLQEKIDRYKSKNMIGVHIRRADNLKSIIYSPLQKFIERMHEEIAQDNRIRFFVATDDPSAEIRLKEVFKDRVIFHPKKSVARNNPLAIEDAVVDLFCLANCRKLIGSYWSSYTNAAWQINQIEYIIIHYDGV